MVLPQDTQSVDDFCTACLTTIDLNTKFNAFIKIVIDFWVIECMPMQAMSTTVVSGTAYREPEIN